VERSSVIPRVIHHVWVGSPLPDWARRNIEEWRRLHPSWGGVIWTDENMPPLMNQKLYDRAPQIVGPDAVGQFRADLARYEILYRQGGFYADVDTVPLRPIDDALEGHSEFAVAEDAEWIGNTYLGAEPGCTIMLALIGNLSVHLSQKASNQIRASVASGPQYMTPIWKKLGGYVDTRTELFFPYSYAHVKRNEEKRAKIRKDAYCVHLWAHQRELSGRGLT
jgi:mannosyltransferase OCH1-like enzyme